MRFGGLLANNDVTFDIYPGEIVGLIGPNGAGKTTLFNCISGFLRPTAGTVLFKGENITGLKPHQICHRGLARTFQITQPLRDMTVLENVMVGTFCRYPLTSQARAKAIEILKMTGMWAKRHQKGSELTIPDRKRLEIARALGTEPDLLILDEAMAGLNPAEIHEAVELVKTIQAQGITLFIIEHVMEAIMPIADRIVVLDAGRLIAEGPPSEIVHNERVIEAYLGEGRHVKRKEHTS
ncbi:MAG: ABC transporter ATP-binding protein [Firmicutes bacterium]|jgi:branched-chain amino acid transport system ATP-binding protein|nr:ABC transporter ATP-binding protein [Bacillota bacterium]